MGLISFEYNTHLLQGKKSSKDELGRIFFFWPWPNSVIPMKSDPGVAFHKYFWGRETHKTSIHTAWARFAGPENLLFQGGGCNCKGEQVSSEYEEFMSI